MSPSTQHALDQMLVARLLSEYGTDTLLTWIINLGRELRPVPSPGTITDPRRG